MKILSPLLKSIKRYTTCKIGYHYSMVYKDGTNFSLGPGKCSDCKWETNGLEFNVPPMPPVKPIKEVKPANTPLSDLIQAIELYEDNPITRNRFAMMDLKDQIKHDISITIDGNEDIVDGDKL
jgi:hypothetical protein